MGAFQIAGMRSTVQLSLLQGQNYLAPIQPSSDVKSDLETTTERTAAAPQVMSCKAGADVDVGGIFSRFQGRPPWMEK